MEVTVDNALDIAQKAAYRLFYKKYRGCLKDWDEFFSDTQFLVFQKFAQFDPKIGSFEGYINMYVEFAAVRILSATKKRSDRGVTHIGTIDDVARVSKDLPDELDWVVRKALELFEDPTVTRTDSCRKRLRAELKKQGWKKERIQQAFAEIDQAITGDRTYCYAKKDQADA